MTSNPGNHGSVDFSSQPVRHLQTLVDWIGLPRLRRGADLADQVTFGPPGPGMYEAEVAGHRVSYDGMMFPGAARCDCGATIYSPYCEHLCAVALVVFGRGALPGEAAAGFPGVVRGYPDDSRYGDGSANAWLCAHGEDVELDPWLDGEEFPWPASSMPDAQCRDVAAASLAELRATGPGADALRESVASVCADADQIGDAGRPDMAVRLLQDAVAPARDAVRRLLDDAPVPAEPAPFGGDWERAEISRLGDPLLDRIVAACPPRNGAMLAWIEDVIDGEADDEETILMRHIRVLLDDDQLAELLDWLTARRGVGGNLKEWGRRLSLAGFLGDEVGYAQIISEAPDGAQAAVMVYYRGRPPTAASVATTARFLDRGLVSLDRDDRQAIDAGSVVEWLAGADRDDARDLVRRIAVECFDVDVLWRSMEVFSEAFGHGDAARAHAFELAGLRSDGTSVDSAPKDQLAAAVIESHFREPDPTVELIDFDAAVEVESRTTLDAAEHFLDRFPSTAATAAMAACYRAQQAWRSPPNTPGVDFFPADIVACIEMVARAEEARGTPRRFWGFLMALHDKHPIGGFHRSRLALRGLWPGQSEPW